MQKAWRHTQPAAPAGGYFFLLHRANIFFFSFPFHFFGVGEEVGVPPTVFSLIAEFYVLEGRK